MDAARSSAFTPDHADALLPYVQLHPLKSFADVIVSYQFRGRLPFDSAGDTHVVQGKDIDDQHRFIPHDLARVSEPRPGLYDRFLLREDDVLLMNRGQRLYATHIQHAPIRLIATTTFHCVRMRTVLTQPVTPPYLVWFLNEPATQTILAREATGTTIQALSADKLRDLRVAVPPLHEQQRILDLAHAIDAEERLSRELTRQRRAQLSALVRAHSADALR